MFQEIWPKLRTTFSCVESRQSIGASQIMEPKGKITVPSPVAARARYQNADLKAAPENPKSDLGHGVTVALRKRTKLGTQGAH